MSQRCLDCTNDTDCAECVYRTMSACSECVDPGVDCEVCPNRKRVMNRRPVYGGRKPPKHIPIAVHVETLETMSEEKIKALELEYGCPVIRPGR